MFCLRGKILNKYYSKIPASKPYLGLKGWEGFWKQTKSVHLINCGPYSKVSIGRVFYEGNLKLFRKSFNFNLVTFWPKKSVGTRVQICLSFGYRLGVLTAQSHFQKLKFKNYIEALTYFDAKGSSFGLSLLYGRGAQLKSRGGPKKKFRNIRGPKLIYFFPFKGCFCQINKLKLQNFLLCGPN